MKLMNYFDISRFWLLLKMELFRSGKGILMVLEIAFGLTFFVGLLLETIVEENKVIHEYNVGFAFLLITGGFILSSLAFNDLGNTLKRYSYLTLPASTFEKFICMWFLTSVGWIVLFTIIYTIYSLMATAIGQLIFSHLTFQPFDPLGELATDAIKYYFVLHGIFMVGASRFKRHVFPKTLFTLVLVAMVFGIIFYFIMGDLMSSDIEECFTESSSLKEMAVYQIWLIVQWLFWWILAPLCWVITYLGLKEQEA